MNQLVLDHMNNLTRDVRVFALPDHVTSILEGSVAQTKEQIAAAGDALKDVSGKYDEAIGASRSDVAELRDKIISNAQRNTANALQFTTDLVTAKTPKELANVHQQFWIKQSFEVARQSHELTKLTQAIMASSFNMFGAKPTPAPDAQ